MKGKVKAIDRHLDKRAEERLGATLSPGLKRELVDRIQRGQATFLSRSSTNRTKWITEIGGIRCVVVYDKKRKQIVTTWPLRAEGAPA